MSLRWNQRADRFYDDASGRFVTRTRGLRSSTARPEFERSQAAVSAGREALRLAEQILRELIAPAVVPAPAAPEIPGELIMDLPIFAEVDEETDRAFFDEDYFEDLDIETDEADLYTED